MYAARGRLLCPAGPARPPSASQSQSPSLHQLRPLQVAHACFRQDAKALGHLLIRLLDLAEVAAEAILVHLLIGLRVPQPAIVRTDLVGQDNPHFLVLPLPAELQL